MGRVWRLSFTSLVLIFYLVRLSDSNVCSARIENDSEETRVDKSVLQNFKSYQGLQCETSNWLRGRRSTGQPKTSSEKIVLDSELKTHVKNHRSMRKILTAKRNTKGSSDELPLEAAATDQHTAAFKHLSSYDSFQKITESKDQADAAVSEMHSMVHMDYQRRARRKPPINNGLPLKQGQLHAEP